LHARELRFDRIVETLGESEGFAKGLSSSSKTSERKKKSIENRMYESGEIEDVSGGSGRIGEGRGEVHAM